MKINKKIQAGILVLIIGVPAFVFLFLEFFGSNRFELLYFYPYQTKEKGINLNEPLLNLSKELKTYGFHPFEANNSKVGDSLYLNLHAPSLRDVFSTNGEYLLILDEIGKEEGKIPWSRVEQRMLSRFPGEYSLIMIPAHKIPLRISQVLTKNIRNDLKPVNALLVDSMGFVRGCYNLKDVVGQDLLITEYEVLNESKR